MTGIPSLKASASVDEVLRTAAILRRWISATRDYYRRAIEDLSRGSHHSEIGSRRTRAVHRAKRARAEARGNGQPRERPQSRSRLLPDFAGPAGNSSGKLAFRGPLAAQAAASVRAALRCPGYLGTIAIAHGADPGVAAGAIQGLWASALPVVDFAGLLAVVPASDLAITLDQSCGDGFVWAAHAAAAGIEATEFRRKCAPWSWCRPCSHRREMIREQVERLEVHYLANSDGDLRFALLSDWVDADTETLPGDDELLAAAREGISRLNQRYGPGSRRRCRFYLVSSAARSGTRASENGWDGSASAENCTS